MGEARVLVDVDIMSAFDQVTINILNKSALIYIAAKNMGFETGRYESGTNERDDWLLIYRNKSEA